MSEYPWLVLGNFAENQMQWKINEERCIILAVKEPLMQLYGAECIYVENRAVFV